MGSIPGSGRSPGGGNDVLLQYSCLEKFHGQRSLGSESQRVRHDCVTEHTRTLELLDWAFVFWGMSNIYVISIRRNPVVCGSVFTLENYYYYSLKKLFFLPHFKAVVGESNGTPLQYSCLENPMDGGAW